MALSNDQRAQQASAQIANFEGERYGHELNLARYNAIPEDKRDDGWNRLVREAIDAIDTIDNAITTTRAAAKAAKAGDPVVDIDAIKSDLEKREEAAEAEAEVEADAEPSGK